ncbi:hypothetical protein T265_11236 [Opisthorchis viverrini]|uniref:EGF-like domain-containing protein n=1 Tax=Opisthorchis viverrini TaxID=6198 RepID=A0A074ZYD8_OPIVI|nr:hypothetical protein T265_11236 [Opisthorchis viverrini]KER20154.1 hypothetical protein T265_11236 [Opisthorchis viverrini]
MNLDSVGCVGNMEEYTVLSLRPMSTSSGACVAKSRWELYCDEKGTQRRDYVEGKEICVCRESHMGPRCEKLRDPCIDTSDPRMLAGNAACNSPEGGMCFGYLGSNAYKCNCSNGYMSDAAYPHSNCLRLRDSCLSRVCVYGDCISSKDGQVGLSVCTSTGKVVDSYLQQKDAFAYQWDAFLLNQWMYRKATVSVLRKPTESFATSYVENGHCGLRGRYAHHGISSRTTDDTLVLGTV